MVGLPAGQADEASVAPAEGCEAGEDALVEMKQYGFKPEHETYLKYLADYVVGFMRQGALDARKLFLRGSAGDAAATAAQVAASTLPRGERRGG